MVYLFEKMLSQNQYQALGTYFYKKKEIKLSKIMNKMTSELQLSRL